VNRARQRTSPPPSKPPARLFSRPPSRPLPGPQAADRGFTLVEVLVAIALLVMLTWATTVFLPEALERRRLAALADQTLTALQAARVEAQAHGRAVRVSTPGDGTSCLLVHLGPRESCRCDAPAGPQCDAPARLIVAVPSTSPLGMTLRATAPSAVYDPVLGTVTPTLTVHLAGRRGTEVRHVVNLTGRVRSCVATGALPGWSRC
jgi:type IV fimbrial biogenesis protein FimT